MDVEAYDPELRSAARRWSLLTARTSWQYRWQAHLTNALVGAVTTVVRTATPRGAGTGPTGDVEQLQRWVPRADGRQQSLLVMRPRPGSALAGDAPVPAVLWLHGGGYAVGTPEISRATVERLVSATGCVVALPDYRLSTRAPYPAALEDCYCALLWLRDHAAQLGADPDQLVVGGESAGGGLTAATTLLARDRGEVAVAFQVPLYPMIDDRPTSSSRASDAPVWNTVSNDAAWGLYLGSLRGAADVPATAAPARATDLAGLPPTLTFVGDAEPFHDEVVTWVVRLREAGVPVLSKVFPRAFHAFDLMVPDAAVSREATAFLLEGFRDFAAQYRAPQLPPR